MKKIKQENITTGELAEQVRSGKTVVYPTETCYGIGCDGENKSAVERVFKIKRRDKNKPLLVLMPDQDTLREYIEWNSNIEKLSDQYWPGPITIVADLKQRVSLPRGLIKDGALACRVSPHDFASDLTDKLGGPLVSTSANVSGEDSPYTADAAVSMFEDSESQPDIIVDAGELEYSPPSTVVKVTGDDIEVLREGAINL